METKCSHCGTPLNKKPDKRSKTGNIFCNSSCAASYNNVVAKKRTAQHFCKDCGKVLWGGSFSGMCGPCYKFSKYIDTKTLAEIMAKRKDNNRYTVIRAAARRIYLRSNLPKECIACGYKKHFEVCHVKDIAKFDPKTPIKEINALDNLVAFCRNHHWEYDHQFLFLEKVDPVGFEPTTNRFKVVLIT